MASAPPPPPPPLPPPPPPPPPQDPPPQAPVSQLTEEEETSIRSALINATSALEKGRCLQSELQASLLMSSSLIENANSKPVENLPGGLLDAWDVVVPEKAAKGQTHKARHTTALFCCLERAAQVAKQVQEHPKQSNLKESAHLAKQGPPSLWLQVLDQRLREIRTYHARHMGVEPVAKRPRLGNPAADGYDLASILSERLTPLNDEVFTTEEVMGKYLDLQAIYETHVVPLRDTLQVPTLVEFLTLLLESSGLAASKLPEATKLQQRKKYVALLEAMEDYLKGFLKRTCPLLDLTSVPQSALDELETEWRQHGGVKGVWEYKATEASLAEKGEPIDLQPYSSAQDLASAVEAPRLKAELTRLGLKSGGTVQDCAKRLFATKDTPLDQLPKKFFRNWQGRLDIARLEVRLAAFLDQVRPTLEATVRRAERRLTQTPKEREQELDEELHGSNLQDDEEENKASDDSEDEDAPIYNPKGVPLGWDGKPIPYWLFKLHGLNHFYPCEICGNESYRGRRNFEMHFTEAKHAYGMKCLGIPNTKHFHGVTSIEDAQKLWRTLQEKLKEETFDGTKEEEYEDSHGNVLSRATYEDLARQGLL